jgi:hypothetical protein
MCSFQAAATVGDEVAFEKAGLDVVPFGEGAYRDLLLEQPPWLRGRDAHAGGGVAEATDPPWPS